MKKSVFLLISCCFFFTGAYCQVQSNKPGKTSSTATSPDVKQKQKSAIIDKKTIDQDNTKKPTPVDKNRQLKEIDGRKVMIDNQGVQSLQTPPPDPVKEK